MRVAICIDMCTDVHIFLCTDLRMNMRFDGYACVHACMHDGELHVMHAIGNLLSERIVLHGVRGAGIIAAVAIVEHP